MVGGGFEDVREGESSSKELECDSAIQDKRGTIQLDYCFDCINTQRVRSK